MDDVRGRRAQSGCVIGADYPEPIVDHGQARHDAMNRHGAAAG
ncbi:MAG: hypothetical protein ICV69_03405 [Thermoleophilaceae bacterium]|nr:hypothetical protein [Thermoleophilaceae bacterium]